MDEAFDESIYSIDDDMDIYKAAILSTLFKFWKQKEKKHRLLGLTGRKKCDIMRLINPLDK
ncbi:MAG: hypothetical protein RSD95_11375 [Clostridia bacterium]